MGQIESRIEIFSGNIKEKLIEAQNVVIAQDLLKKVDPTLPIPQTLPTAYQEMIAQTAIRFPHCSEEIKAFFYLQTQINQEASDNNVGDTVSRGTARSVQWAMFWEGIKKLETERHNEEVSKKKQEKLKRKGKANARKDQFNGPTYAVRR